jgi:DNA polymerase elongation subunit (family B)
LPQEPRRRHRHRPRRGVHIGKPSRATGPEPVGEETAPPDYDHYVTHQIEPGADAVLWFLGTDFATVVQSRKQLSLFS